MGLRKFLRKWNDFAAKTEFGSVLEYFCRIEAGIRIFCPKKTEKRNWTQKNFVQKSKKDKGSWAWNKLSK